MKQLSKVLWVFAFIFILLACQDGSNDVLKGADNKHSNARTNADISVSGTATVPAGTYGYIIIAPGSNITLAHNVKFNSFIYSGAVTLNIPSGATVTMYHSSGLYPGSTFTNRGKFICEGGFYMGSYYGVTTFNNLGTHAIGDGLYMDSTCTYNQSILASFQANKIETRYDNARFVFTGTSTLITPSITVNTVEMSNSSMGTVALFQGKGKVNTNGGTIIRAILTGSPNIKICTTVPFTYLNGGSFGTGVLSCQ